MKEMREYYGRQIHSDQLAEMGLNYALGANWDDAGGFYAWEREMGRKKSCRGNLKAPEAGRGWIEDF